MVRAKPARSDRQVLLGGMESLERRDCPAALGISDVSLLEGTRTSPLARFVVSLSEKSSSAVTVNWQTSDGTATVADGDYRPASGTLFFAAGQVSKVITVYVRGDARVEETETFNVRLSGAVGATLVRTEATGTILNDDEPPAFVPQPELSIADVELIEKNTGRSEARFTVALSAATNVPVSVRWATKNGTATAADRDYLAASSKLVFAPGEMEELHEPITDEPQHPGDPNHRCGPAKRSPSLRGTVGAKWPVCDRCHTVSRRSMSCQWRRHEPATQAGSCHHPGKRNPGH